MRFRGAAGAVNRVGREGPSPVRGGPGPLAGLIGGFSPRRGQVLLVAVLLMMAILLLGSLFVAIVSYNQYQTVRHGDMLMARALAEAGIRYADYMLTHSPLGADWRPPLPPGYNVTTGVYDADFWGPDGNQYTEDDYYLPEEIARGYFTQYTEGLTGRYLQRLGFTRYPVPSSTGADLLTMGRGHVLLRVTYDPDPPFEPSEGYSQEPLSRFIRIEAIGVVEGRTPIMRRLVAFKPIGLTDYLRWVTDRHRTGRTAHLGSYPWVDMDSSGVVEVDTQSPPGQVPVTERGEYLVSEFNGPVRVDTKLQLIGGNLSGNPFGGSLLDPSLSSNQFRILLSPRAPGGYLRDDVIEVRGGITDPVPGAGGVWAQSAAVSWDDDGDGQVDYWQLIRESRDSQYDTHEGRVLDGVEGVDTNGRPRFVRPVSPPDIFATDPGTGADRYRALTKDAPPYEYSPPLPDLVPLPDAPGSRVKVGQLGHGRGIYVDNAEDVQFVRADGSHDLQSLIEDWLRQIPSGDPRAADSGWNALHTLYVPPGVEVELYPTEDAVLEAATAPGQPRPTIVTDPNAPPTAPGAIWWPGHVRGEPGIKLVRHDKRWRRADGEDSGLNVMYRDYPRWPNAVIFAEGNLRVRGILPRRGANQSPGRDYNITIVSGGTIYIDGQILSPRDVDPNVVAEDDTKIALLARDHVCLNTTMLVPQFTSGMVPAVPDDPANPDADKMHWNLAAGMGLLWTSFCYGAVTPNRIRTDFVIQHTAAPPGPSGVGMTIGSASLYGPYDFDGVPTAPSYYTFALLSPGTPPSAASVNAVAPVWATTRWPLYLVDPNNKIPGLDPSPGQSNVISLFQRDPRVGLGATDYWVKRWKLQDWENIGNPPVPRPVGTLKARVNAIIYAQEGCWFVLPGDYFDPDAKRVDLDQDGVADSVEYKRYNYEITVRGTIVENYTAPPAAVRDWTDKWAYPVWPALDRLCWSSIRYEYDESLRAGRDQPPTSLVGNVRVSNLDPLYNPSADIPVAWNMPRVPVLPVCPDLIFFGEAF
ncbi:MAG: hypothetical protein N2512_05985 [Armatimonadetes bacterium]|nr:hypothetical protein [Armatimonadota bacterium]